MHKSIRIFCYYIFSNLLLLAGEFQDNKVSCVLPRPEEITFFILNRKFYEHFIRSGVFNSSINTLRQK
jgi:hypothetical protein